MSDKINTNNIKKKLKIIISNPAFNSKITSPIVKNLLFRGRSIDNLKKYDPHIMREVISPVMINTPNDNFEVNSMKKMSWSKNKINYSRLLRKNTYPFINYIPTKKCKNIKFININIILSLIYFFISLIGIPMWLNIFFSAILSGLNIFFGYMLINNLRNIGKNMIHAKKLDFEIHEYNNIIPFEETETIQDTHNKTLKTLNFLSYYISDNVFKMISNKSEPIIGYEHKNVSIFFSDIQDFTKITEDSDPELIAELLSDYYQIIYTTIQKYNATLSDFIGDGTMAFLNAPYDIPNHQVECVNMACDIQKNLNKIIEKYKNHNINLKVRIGCHNGDVLAGNMGSIEFMKYGIIGDSVNLASRLENLNKYYGTSIIISDSLYTRVQNTHVCRIIGIVEVKGRNEIEKIYELYGKNEDVTDYNKEKSSMFNKFYEEFMKKNITNAGIILDEYSIKYPQDKLISIYKEIIDNIYKCNNNSDINLYFIHKHTTK